MPTVRIDRVRPEVAVLTLDRPHRLNALSFELVDELHQALDEIDADNDCRVVILTGAGRAFCSGLDLREIGGASTARGLTGPRAGMRSQEQIAALIPHLRRIQQPVIAAINGPAFGGGLALACAADLRIAAASARLCVQFIKVGVSGCDIGISYTLPRLVGASRAHELILTGREFGASEAQRIGLVADVVEDRAVEAGVVEAGVVEAGVVEAGVVEAALDLAGTLLTASPFGLVMTKEVMWANLDAPSLESAIHLENRTQILAGGTGDMAEAAAAFREGRTPEWSS